jgi:hypothetical protein
VRRLGARVVIAAGKLALYLPQGGKDLLLFTREKPAWRSTLSNGDCDTG